MLSPTSNESFTVYSVYPASPFTFLASGSGYTVSVTIEVLSIPLYTYSPVGWMFTVLKRTPESVM